MEEREKTMIELPFGLPGRIFRSPMPYSQHDPQQDLFDCYLQEGVSTVVLLADDRECLEESGRNLRSLYRSRGIQLLYLPAPDFGTPNREDLQLVVEEALERAQSGEDIVLHCHAGLGRTGTVVACLAKRALGLESEQAIQWTRSYIPGAIEREGQYRLVLEF